VLPPSGNSVTVSQDEGAGAGSGSATDQFSGAYGDFGTSFRVAKWCANGDAIAAVLLGDRGETLVIQPIPKSGERTKKPTFLATADHIDFDVNPKDGGIVFAVTGFHWAGDPKVPVNQRPRHFLALWHMGDPHPTPVVSTSGDGEAYGPPAISPQGDKLIVAVGPFNVSSGQMEPVVLMTMPIQAGAAQAAAQLAKGAIYEPTWSPKGDQIAYARNNGSYRAIYVANADGSNEHSITGVTGRYGFPKFSPQVK